MDSLLIDGDILLYRCGFACQKRTHTVYVEDTPTIEFDSIKEANAHSEDIEGSYVESSMTVEPIENALQAVKTCLNSIYEKLFNTHSIIILSGEGNFRRELDPEYKANRKEEDRPYYYNEIKDYMYVRGALMVGGAEADDLLSLLQDDTTIIVSIDKDMLQVEGLHYNFVKDELVHIDKYGALYNFYTQLLVGDRVDNIIGVPGIGPKKADKILMDTNVKDIQEYENLLWAKVQDAYLQAYPTQHPRDILKLLIKTGNLLWLKKPGREVWLPPQLSEEDYPQVKEIPTQITIDRRGSVIQTYDSNIPDSKNVLHGLLL